MASVGVPVVGCAGDKDEDEDGEGDGDGGEARDVEA